MTRRTIQPSRTRYRQPRSEPEQGTRRQLLEAAGQVFADKGFDRATGKEICEQAGTNTAAVNYYFGGIDGLYAAVVWEAHDCLISLSAITSAVAGKVDARARLEAVLGVIVGSITGPASSSWMLRVIGREFVAPTQAVEPVREKEFLPKSRILKGIVSELMGLPTEHPAVARGCISVMAPCAVLLLFDRRTLKLAFPQLSLTASDAPAFVRHLVTYALAGLAAVAAEARAD